MSGTDDIWVTRPWRQTDKGCWSMSLHGGGVTMRITQRNEGDVFQRIVLVDGKQSWQTLGTTDRDEAERLVRACLRTLITDHSEEVQPNHWPATPAVPAPTSSTTSPAVPPSPPASVAPSCDARPAVLPLGRLFAAYLESGSFANLRDTTQNDYRSRGRILVSGLGPERDAALLDLEALQRYAVQRLAGGIAYDAPRPGAPDLPWEPKRSEPVGETSVGADLALLRHMLHWATETRDSTGSYMLDAFPIRGLRVKRGKAPRRPHVDYARYTELLRAVQRLAAAAEESGDSVWVRRWRLLELALVIAEGTGARVAAVRQLTGPDLALDRQHGFQNARIRWRPTHDKTKQDRYQPLPVDLARLIAALLDRLGISGEMCVFAKVRDRNAAVTYKELSDWFADAERLAGLDKIAGGVWHPLRRKWARERRACSLKDLMAAGGWTDLKTLYGYVGESEEDDLRAVMEAPARARAAKAALDGTRHENTMTGPSASPLDGPPRLRLVRPEPSSFASPSPSGWRRRAVGAVPDGGGAGSGGRNAPPADSP